MRWSRAQHTPSADEMKAMPETQNEHSQENNNSDTDTTHSSGLTTVLPEKGTLPEHKSEPLPNINSSDTDEIQYPGLKIVLPSVISICLAVFLTALDRTIIGVAIPSISNQFNSFDDISWYESAYLLTTSAFQLPMGKIYTFFPSKYAFISNIFIFEIGSIVCAAAPTSLAFIIGRAVAGIGGAGSMIGAMVIFVDLFPLEKRPKWIGILGASFGLASIAGPLLGGLFTSKVSWRWCFWINVPIGGVAMVVLLFVLPLREPARVHQNEGFWQRMNHFDPIGTVILLPALIAVLLGLQWGGNGYRWGSTRVVVSLVVGLVLLVGFGISQWWVGDNGTVPPRILRQRSIAAGSVVSIGFGSSLTILTFYLPIWFQAIKGLSAFGAGIRLLPYFLGTVVFVIGSGFVVSKTGYYTPPLILGTALMIVGGGLLTTFRVDTTTGEYIGYELIIGAGLGLSLTQANNAAQTVLSREDIPIGITIITFSQLAGGSVFVSVAQAILSSTLSAQLSTKIPGFDAARLAATGATDLSTLVPKDLLPVLLAVYNDAIDNVFYCALALSFVAFVASLFMEWKTMRKQVVVTAA